MKLSDALHPETLALPLCQHQIGARLLRYLGYETRSFTLRNRGATAASVLMTRARWLGLPLPLCARRGPVWAGTVALADRCEGLRQLNAEGLLCIDADSPADAAALAAAGYVRAGKVQHVREIDVAARPAFPALPPEVRARLEAADAARLTQRNRPFDADRDGALARKLNLPPKALKALAGLSLVAPAAFRLYSVDRYEVPVAALAIVLHPPVATVMFAWADPDAPVEGALESALDAALRGLQGRGIVRLDLGAPEDPGALPDAVASAFGARTRELGGRWIRLPGLSHAAPMLLSQPGALA